MRVTFNHRDGVRRSMVWRLVTVVAVAVALSGCTGGNANAPSANVTGVANPTPLPAAVELAHLKPGTGYAADALCKLGGPVEIRRLDGARIGEGLHAIRITIDAPPTTSGVRVGYSLDKSPIHWLPVVFNEKATQSIPVDAMAVERSDPRWAFYFSQDVKGAEQGCYTGVTLFQEDILIEAVAGL